MFLAIIIMYKIIGGFYFLINESLNILNKYFGYKSFRKNQQEVINEILKKRDLLAVMPTGAGKSICYQVPALIFEGLTIVISPLISLMKDQVDSLKALGIKCAYINSSLDTYELKEILYGIKNNEYKLIYIAPERLESIEFINSISSVNISQIAVDEAHCISQWGHDFRVSYRKIPYFISKLRTRPIITAFTATASKEVQNDIVRLLGLHNPKVLVGGFDRENLEITIIKEGSKDRFLNDYVTKNNNVSGIIYCATRKEVDDLYEKFLYLGISVSKYHGGLSDIERKHNQEDFINDKVNIMIATNAFGMGIDKPNIRYVIHYNMPQTIENYYQEIGRAGRDGEKSECILLFTPSDIMLQKYLIDKSIENIERKNIAFNKLQQMISLVYSNNCYRKTLLSYFGEEVYENCNNCSNCLNAGELVDKTIDAQKVLSCIYRMKRPFGTTMVVDVLRGSKNMKVLKLAFDKLSTYGIMKEYKKDELTSFINILASYGYVDIVGGTYPVLKLNNISVDIIKGNKKVLLKEFKKAKSKYVVNDLFNELRNLRFTIATSEKIAPYMVFGDNILMEMTKTKPHTKEEMLNISGISKVKYEKYGESFIKKIKEYENGTLPIKENEIINVSTDKNLYEELLKLREEFAKKEKKLPYYIIHKDILKEISGRYPKTLEELLDISGMGKVKVEKYGNNIVKLVNKYIKENNLNIIWQKKGKSKVIIDGERRNHKDISINMLNEGVPIEEVSKKMEISVSTILSYVTEKLQEGFKFKEKINLKVYYDIPEKDNIIKLCEEKGIEQISYIKKELPPNVKYENIRSIILKKCYNFG